MTPLFTPVPVPHQLVGAVVVTDGIRSLPMAFSTTLNGSKHTMQSVVCSFCCSRKLKSARLRVGGIVSPPDTTQR
jgi:hypothetical protein